MSFAVDPDSKCIDCNLKARVKLCPFYLTRCKYVPPNISNKNVSIKKIGNSNGLDNSNDRELE